jgi:uroporphyrinogen-III synthase
VGRILEPELRERFEWALAGGRIAAVGAATAAALRSRGVEPDIVAEGSGASVLRRLPPDLGGCRVLLPRGEDATKELPEELARRGAEVACLVLYRKVPQPHDAGLEREILEKPFGVFCATSPSAARWLFDGLGRAATARLCATPAAVLGRSTARFLEGRGVARVSVAPEATFGAVTRLLESLAAGNPRE